MLKFQSMVFCVHAKVPVVSTLATVAPDRVIVALITPGADGTERPVTPAGTLNVFELLPEDKVTVEGAVANTVAQAASSVYCQPVGFESVGFEAVAYAL